MDLAGSEETELALVGRPGVSVALEPLLGVALAGFASSADELRASAGTARAAGLVESDAPLGDGRAPRGDAGIGAARARGVEDIDSRDAVGPPIRVVSLARALDAVF